jgi:hypothetical protein
MVLSLMAHNALQSKSLHSVARNVPEEKIRDIWPRFARRQIIQSVEELNNPIFGRIFAIIRTCRIGLYEQSHNKKFGALSGVASKVQ